ncbi:hypothetical protein H2198_007752 [Neophaeococcomyces mojaviensis]|uniref:Uncharacterized protein n=1 Tax=Neophaeococcomyces mojaviensis TaxID=3383035 RepID=A0ACC2ZZU6_9EURO|nr:hypothetical protein H2198_007752 [Knufia sp. JES_112]
MSYNLYILSTLLHAGVEPEQQMNNTKRAPLDHPLRGGCAGELREGPELESTPQRRASPPPSCSTIPRPVPHHIPPARETSPGFPTERSSRPSPGLAGIRWVDEIEQRQNQRQQDSRRSSTSTSTSNSKTRLQRFWEKIEQKLRKLSRRKKRQDPDVDGGSLSDEAQIEVLKGLEVHCDLGKRLAANDMAAYYADDNDTLSMLVERLSLGWVAD